MIADAWIYSSPSFEEARIAALHISCIELSPPSSHQFLSNGICPHIAAEWAPQAKLMVTVSDVEKPLLTSHDL